MVALQFDPLWMDSSLFAWFRPPRPKLGSRSKNAAWPCYASTTSSAISSLLKLMPILSTKSYISWGTLVLVCYSLQGWQTWWWWSSSANLTWKHFRSSASECLSNGIFSGTCLRRVQKYWTPSLRLQRQAAHSPCQPPLNWKWQLEQWSDSAWWHNCWRTFHSSQCKPCQCTCASSMGGLWVQGCWRPWQALWQWFSSRPSQTSWLWRWSAKSARSCWQKLPKKRIARWSYFQTGRVHVKSASKDWWPFSISFSCSTRVQSIFLIPSTLGTWMVGPLATSPCWSVISGPLASASFWFLNAEIGCGICWATWTALQLF